MEKKFKKTRP